MFAMRMSKLVYKLFMLLMFCMEVAAQEKFIVPSRFLTKMPFDQLTGGVVLLKARFASFPDTLNFILDTGSGGISLDSATADYLGLNPVPSDKTIRGIGGIKPARFVNQQKLHLPNLTVDSLNFHINDYDILTSVYGEKIDGIIGYSFLSRYIVKVNYDSSFLEVWTKGAIKYPRGGYLLKPNISTLVVQNARVRDQKTIDTRFLYDMGAGLCMMLSTDFLRDSGLLYKRRKFYTKEAEGLGGKIDMSMTVVREVKLGPYRFKNVPVYVFDDVYNITSYPFLGGLIGNDLLRRFNVILNYSKRDIYITPNKHYKEAFDYSYSGIELYYIDGQIVLGDVAKGSPAEKAGLKEGDVLVGLNNVFNASMQQFKSAMQNAGERLKLIIKRDGNLKQYEFKVKNILK